MKKVNHFVDRVQSTMNSANEVIDSLKKQDNRAIPFHCLIWSRLFSRPMIERLWEDAQYGHGCSYEVMIFNFSRSVDLLLEGTPGLLPKMAVVDIAREYEYLDISEIRKMQDQLLESGRCIHGIDPRSCPAGCGDIE